jgi:hypothetical protein
MTKTLFGYWQSRGGKYWLRVFTDGTYRTENGGGNHPDTPPQQLADFIVASYLCDRIELRPTVEI